MQARAPGLVEESQGFDSFPLDPGNYLNAAVGLAVGALMEPGERVRVPTLHFAWPRPIEGGAKMVSDGSITRLIKLLLSDDAVERDLAARLIWRRHLCRRLL